MERIFVRVSRSLPPAGNAQEFGPRKMASKSIADWVFRRRISSEVVSRLLNLGFLVGIKLSFVFSHAGDLCCR